jgi:hypothetical protein
MIPCPTCGAASSDAAAYCGICGHRIADHRNGVAPAAAAAQPPPPEPAPERVPAPVSIPLVNAVSAPAPPAAPVSRPPSRPAVPETVAGRPPLPPIHRSVFHAAQTLIRWLLLVALAGLLFWGWWLPAGP